MYSTEPHAVAADAAAQITAIRTYGWDEYTNTDQVTTFREWLERNRDSLTNTAGALADIVANVREQIEVYDDIAHADFIKTLIHDLEEVEKSVNNQETRKALTSAYLYMLAEQCDAFAEFIPELETL